jgi:NAD dependent epimerase/dehydratase family enzyme
MHNKKIILAGGTGFIGQAPADGYNITYWRWDGRHVEKHWADEIEGSDLVINLAGRSVNCRYTTRNRQEIVDSRTDATKAIGMAIRNATVPPKLWINAASATIYRHAEDRPQDEYTGEMQDDFSGPAHSIHPQDSTAHGHHPGYRRRDHPLSQSLEIRIGRPPGKRSPDV